MSDVKPILDKTLVPLPGEVCTQYIRCGKTGCRCVTGERHGPYYYRIWREGKNVQKAYVRREELETVQAACAAYKSYSHDLRQMRLLRQQSTLRIQREWRRTKRLIQ